MNSSAQMKYQMIEQYILSVDFGGDFSVKKIKEELKKILHEIPAVEIKYKKDIIVTEDLRGNKIKSTDEKVKSIIIGFSDGVNEKGEIVVHKEEFYL
jgi:hypothetical protein